MLFNYIIVTDLNEPEREFDCFERQPIAQVQESTDGDTEDT